MRYILTLFLTLFLTNCVAGMKPEDFKDQEPKLIIEEFLKGNVKAYGVLQNRGGKVTRQFSADLNGKWDGNQLILDEKSIGYLCWGRACLLIVNLPPGPVSKRAGFESPA